MIAPNKNIVLIGFKHVGKTSIGKRLANALDRKFIDLDMQIEKNYETTFHESFSCREIMQKRGDAFFRELETQNLKKTMGEGPAIISVGGGTPLKKDNQALIKEGTIVHITAPRGVVFERIMLHGRPAFFSNDLHPFTAFNQLWEEREPVYEKLAQFTLQNNGSLQQAVETLIEFLTTHPKAAAK